MKKFVLELLLMFGLIVLVKLEEISFFQSCILYLFAIAGDIVIQKLNNIEKQLNKIIYELSGTHHINCRHTIGQYINKEGETNDE